MYENIVLVEVAKVFYNKIAKYLKMCHKISLSINNPRKYLYACKRLVGTTPVAHPYWREDIRCMFSSQYDVGNGDSNLGAL